MPGMGWTPAIPAPGLTHGYGYGMGYAPHPTRLEVRAGRQEGRAGRRMEA